MKPIVSAAIDDLRSVTLGSTHQRDQTSICGTAERCPRRWNLVNRPASQQLDGTSQAPPSSCSPTKARNGRWSAHQSLLGETLPGPGNFPAGAARRTNTSVGTCPELSRARLLWARRSEPWTARTVLALHPSRRVALLGKLPFPLVSLRAGFEATLASSSRAAGGGANLAPFARFVHCQQIRHQLPRHRLVAIATLALPLVNSANCRFHLGASFHASLNTVCKMRIALLGDRPPFRLVRRRHQRRTQSAVTHRIPNRREPLI
jgi:hypothetical protein